VRLAHIPVYVVRASLIQKPCLKYVIAIDGSKVTDFSIDCIRGLARPEDEIIIVTILPGIKEAEALIQTHKAKLIPAPFPEAKITTKAYARNAEVAVAENICAIADELDADTLVLATGWKRSTTDLGSVTSSCIYQSKLKCNLFIYKNPRLLEMPNSTRRISSQSSAP
jgi:nucleotide-binding universal stress UspA family protein